MDTADRRARARALMTPAFIIAILMTFINLILGATIVASGLFFTGTLVWACTLEGVYLISAHLGGVHNNGQ